jgi:hypothetical protein
MLKIRRENIHPPSSPTLRQQREKVGGEGGSWSHHAIYSLVKIGNARVDISYYKYLI